jgi:hypothetical protein
MRQYDENLLICRHAGLVQFFDWKLAFARMTLCCDVVLLQLQIELFKAGGGFNHVAYLALEYLIVEINFNVPVR